jgi:hypothetical protein
MVSNAGEYMKIISIVAVVILIGIIGALFVYFGWNQSKPDQGTELQRIDTLHEHMSAQDIPTFENTIKTGSNYTVRERAMMALTDVAITTNSTSDIIPFLKDIAIHDPNETIRMAAQSQIDLIRQYYPLERIVDFNVTVKGDIRVNSPIIIIVNITSDSNVDNVRFGLQKIDTKENTPSEGLALSSQKNILVKFPMKTGEKKEISYNFVINKEGTYKVTYVLSASNDQIDNLVIKKDVFIRVNGTSGEYMVVESPTQIF